MRNIKLHSLNVEEIRDLTCSIIRRGGSSTVLVELVEELSERAMGEVHVHAPAGGDTDCEVG